MFLSHPNGLPMAVSVTEVLMCGLRVFPFLPLFPSCLITFERAVFYFFFPLESSSFPCTGPSFWTFFSPPDFVEVMIGSRLFSRLPPIAVVLAHPFFFFFSTWYCRLLFSPFFLPPPCVSPHNLSFVALAHAHCVVCPVFFIFTALKKHD